MTYSVHISEITALHVAAKQLKDCPAEKLLKSINSFDEKIQKTINGSLFGFAKKNLEDIRTRLKGMSEQLLKNPKANLQLDCLGIAARIRATFKPVWQLQVNNEYSVQTYFRTVVQTNLHSLEDEILKKDFDFNMQPECEAPIPDVCGEALALDKERDAVFLLRTCLRAGVETHAPPLAQSSLGRVCLDTKTPNKTALLRVLLRHENPNQRLDNSDVRSELLPLAVAALSEDVFSQEHAQMLISHGMDVDLKEFYSKEKEGNESSPNPNAPTPFYQACMHRRFHLVESFIWNGASTTNSKCALAYRNFNGVREVLPPCDFTESVVKESLAFRATVISRHSMNGPLTLLLRGLPFFKDFSKDCIAIVATYLLTNSEIGEACLKQKQLFLQESQKKTSESQTKL